MPRRKRTKRGKHYVYWMFIGPRSKGKSRRIYIGMTNNLSRRLAEHISGRGARTTRHQSIELCNLELFNNRRAAAAREYELKHNSDFKGKEWRLEQIAKCRYDFSTTNQILKQFDDLVNELDGTINLIAAGD